MDNFHVQSLADEIKSLRNELTNAGENAPSKNLSFVGSIRWIHTQ